ncbi:hypothetical protein [Aureimonas psammosilenae]|uniref:hypothetical protein n=1 Tax=Aureimonas psammosilenae TaxID=2495496 RepID=UPI0012606294|nr:hypothetical protein [Aureimonas psammosilenae]
MDTALNDTGKETSFDEWSDPNPVASMFERPMASPTPEEASAPSQVSVYTGGFVRQDWSNAMLLVERAARTIRDYEQKFTTIERDARQFLKRVEEDQIRYCDQIASLELRLKQTEERLKAANAENWDRKLQIQQLQKNLRAAEEEMNQSSDYIRKVESLLGNF